MAILQWLYNVELFIGLTGSLQVLRAFLGVRDSYKYTGWSLRGTNLSCGPEL